MRFSPDMETQAAYDGWKRGRKDGMALGLITILSYRGIPVPPHIHKLIYACRDHKQIQRWVAAAATATTINEVFAPDAETASKSSGTWFRNDADYWIRFGRIEGVALGLIEVLAARGVMVSDQDSDRVLEAFDIEAVDQWVQSALTARTIQEFFDRDLDA